MTPLVQLPPLYELVTLEQTPDITAEAMARAAGGAEEGTLVWAHKQVRSPQPGLRRQWICAPQGLICALVLRPEMPVPAAMQLAMVGAVSLGAALADIVSPLTRLHYRWPTTILLNEGKAADLWFAAGPLLKEQAPWCVLGLGVNVEQPPAELGLAAAGVQREGDCRTSPAEVLEHFARHFLSWINRWADDGFGVVRQGWLQRASGMGEQIRIAFGEQEVRGTAVDVDTDGALLVEVAGQTVQRITLREYFLGTP